MIVLLRRPLLNLTPHPHRFHLITDHFAVRPHLPVEVASPQQTISKSFYHRRGWTRSTTEDPTDSVHSFIQMERSYTFPVEKIATVLKDSTKTPLVLISCGSFSPITYLHLRMFEMCADWVKENTHFEVVAGYLSPVSDDYKKGSGWIMVDDWEGIKKEYTTTARVLDHFHHEINNVRGGVQTDSGKRKVAQVSLLSGADLIGTMSHPGVWAHEDLEHILGRYGAFIIERSGTDMEAALASLNQWKDHIYPIPQLIQNDVSSTKIRQFLRKDMSIRYLIPDPVYRYIEERGLFKEEVLSKGHSRNSSKDKPTENGIQA